MSSSVFVAGATGYIGEGIAKAFRRAGYKVYGLVRDQQRAQQLIRQEIIPVVANIEDTDSYADVLAQCSVIVDAVGWGKHAPAFLEAAEKAGRARNPGDLDIYKPLYIFTSGIMTYGVASSGPVDENTKPKPGFVDMKEREEFENKVLQTGKKQHSYINPVMVRPGFVYGGQGGFVANIFFNVDLNQDLVLYGRTNKRWSWVHVDDLGDAYALIADAGSIVYNQSYNLAAPNDNPTYEELRVAIAKQAGWDPKVRKIDYRQLSAEPTDGIENEYQRWEADVIINPAKAINQLNWKPRHVGFLHEIETYYKSWKSFKN
jgi:UDP-glucose 4-epimerase